MNLIQCIFQSFDGVGTIYITKNSVLTIQHLKRYSCRALITISKSKNLPKENIKDKNLKKILIQIDNSAQKLTPLFLKASQFIYEARKDTNIMIYCPQSRQLAAVFAFAHMILRYGYTIQYIWRIYDQRILNITLSQYYISQLNSLTAKKQNEQEELQKSTLGKRILRIRRKYSQLGRDSAEIVANKKNQIICQLNPEKSSKKGLSETDYIESCESQPSVFDKRGHSYDSTKRTHRKFLSSDFDFAF